MGVLYYKAPPKTSSNGNDFSIWKLTDLKVTKLLVILAFSFFFRFLYIFWKKWILNGSIFSQHRSRIRVRFKIEMMLSTDDKYIMYLILRVK